MRKKLKNSLRLPIKTHPSNIGLFCACMPSMQSCFFMKNQALFGWKANSEGLNKQIMQFN